MSDRPQIQPLTLLLVSLTLLCGPTIMLGSCWAYWTFLVSFGSFGLLSGWEHWYEIKFLINIQYRCDCWLHQPHFAGHARVKMFVPSLQFRLCSARYRGHGGSSSCWSRGGHSPGSSDGSLHVRRSRGRIRDCCWSFLDCLEDSEEKR